jgi:hypothetical protein
MLSRACIINETAARYFGWDDPIGMRLDNNRYTVIGVVKDYHIMDVHNPIDPVVLILDDGEMTGDRVFAFRHASGLRDDAEACWPVNSPVSSLMIRLKWVCWNLPSLPKMPTGVTRHLKDL